MKRISKMKQLPCIRDKCIAYPACRNREEVDCSILYDYYDMYPNYRAKNIWFKICKNLPKLRRIRVSLSEDGMVSRVHTKPYSQIEWELRRGMGLKCYTRKGIP